jgi:hypothetical protein
LLLTMEHRGVEQMAGREIACLPVWDWLLQDGPVANV